MKGINYGFIYFGRDNLVDASGYYDDAPK